MRNYTVIHHVSAYHSGHCSFRMQLTLTRCKEDIKPSIPSLHSSGATYKNVPPTAQWSGERTVCKYWYLVLHFVVNCIRSKRFILHRIRWRIRKLDRAILIEKSRMMHCTNNGIRMDKSHYQIHLCIIKKGKKIKI